MGTKFWQHFKVFLTLLGILLLTIFAVNNSSQVELSFGFTTVIVSQAIVIMVSAMIGALIAYLVFLFSSIKRKSLEKMMELRKKKTEEEARDFAEAAVAEAPATETTPDFVNEAMQETQNNNESIAS